MKFTRLLLSTRKESVSSIDVYSQELLVRAGYIRQLSAGIFSSLHLAQRTLRKIEDILREEMDAIGGVEISMPVVHPADIWKKTKRYDDIDDSLVRFTDRAKRDMVLGMTHEEVVASLAKTEIATYKQLPKLVYQLQTKFRDEARSRGGLIRVREFIMKDSYSLDTSWEGLEKQYQAHYDAYFRMFGRAGLPVIAIKSDVGMMGGRIAHEYMYIADIGEDTIFICESTGYKANKEIATIKKPVIAKEDAKPLEKVHTPGAKTIADLAEFLQMDKDQFGKVVMYSGYVNNEEIAIMAVVPGDMEVNPVKLQNLVKSKYLNPASAEEFKATGAVPGYASPVGVNKDKVIVVADDMVVAKNNLVLGANEEDYHSKNVCYGRDYEADFVGDIINAYDGALAPNAESDSDVLRSVRGVEAGNIFQLGTKYTEAMEARFTDSDGKSKPIIMGSYGIGVGRMLGCLAEEYHDDRGLMLPITVAPFEVIIVGLLDNTEVQEKAESLYQSLKDAKVDVLYDDRTSKMARAGEKFGDADLIGIPIRLTVSKRSIKQDGVEVKLRKEQDSEMVSFDEIVSFVQNKVASLKEEIDQNIQS
ncbi:MAG: proline--tRNA ligase [Bacteroidota bacterium]